MIGNNMEINSLFNGIYTNRKVLITGHTGFKGSWLAFWLYKMGAEVCGYSLEAPTEPNHFNLLELPIRSEIGDIRDQKNLNKVFTEFQPEIVFHLAAQPLVRLSYLEPIETYETNVIGTLKVLEICKKTTSVKAIINVTSDKCYDNKEWIWGYRENDAMGGFDPYSSSKGCAELLASAYRNSYFNLHDYGKKHTTLLASVRAGNVIGGGDWAIDRLIPDIIKAVSQNIKVQIRNPNATRPWQHVLEPLSGYLLVGQKLLEGNMNAAEAWNFGPEEEGSISVKKIVENFKKYWAKIEYEINTPKDLFHEANLLKLDCSKAHNILSWNPVWNSEKTFKITVEWYKMYYENNIIITESDLIEYITDARNKEINWAK